MINRVNPNEIRIKVDPLLDEIKLIFSADIQYMKNHKSISNIKLIKIKKVINIIYTYIHKINLK